MTGRIDQGELIDGFHLEEMLHRSSLVRAAAALEQG
jgi:hypothetical protein